MADIHQLFDGMIAQAHLPETGQNQTRTAEYADENLAMRFTARHQDDLRFVNTWGRWLVWSGTRWQSDETILVNDHIRALVREASGEVLANRGRQGLARSVASAKTVSAIERLARADRRHASQTGDWDRDPWLLNTPTGTIDLKTGRCALTTGRT